MMGACILVHVHVQIWISSPLWDRRTRSESMPPPPLSRVYAYAHMSIHTYIHTYVHQMWYVILHTPIHTSDAMLTCMRTYIRHDTRMYLRAHLSFSLFDEPYDFCAPEKSCTMTSWAYIVHCEVSLNLSCSVSVLCSDRCRVKPSVA